MYVGCINRGEGVVRIRSVKMDCNKISGHRATSSTPMSISSGQSAEIALPFRAGPEAAETALCITVELDTSSEEGGGVLTGRANSEKLLILAGVSDTRLEAEVVSEIIAASPLDVEMKRCQSLEDVWELQARHKRYKPLHPQWTEMGRTIHNAPPSQGPLQDRGKPDPKDARHRFSLGRKPGTTTPKPNPVKEQEPVLEVKRPVGGATPVQPPPVQRAGGQLPRATPPTSRPPQYPPAAQRETSGRPEIEIRVSKRGAGTWAIHIMVVCLLLIGVVWMVADWGRPDPARAENPEPYVPIAPIRSLDKPPTGKSELVGGKGDEAPMRAPPKEEPPMAPQQPNKVEFSVPPTLKPPPAMEKPTVMLTAKPPEERKTATEGPAIVQVPPKPTVAVPVEEPPTDESVKEVESFVREFYANTLRFSEGNPPTESDDLGILRFLAPGFRKRTPNSSPNLSEYLKDERKYLTAFHEENKPSSLSVVPKGGNYEVTIDYTHTAINREKPDEISEFKIKDRLTVRPSGAAFEITSIDEISNVCLRAPRK